MHNFCSKDCPDFCQFDLAEPGSRVRFVPTHAPGGKVPFVCGKLDDFYLRETGEARSHQVRSSQGIQEDVTAEVAMSAAGRLLERHRESRIGLLVGSGSLGLVATTSWKLLMSAFPDVWMPDSNPCSATGNQAHMQDFGARVNPSLEALESCRTILLFGKNARVTSPHLYAWIANWKRDGRRVILIDPICTPTADIADSYLCIRPATDGFLCRALVAMLQGTDHRQPEIQRDLERCGIGTEDALSIVAALQEPCGLITGMGLQRYSNGKNSVQWINRLARAAGQVDRLFYTHPMRHHIDGEPELPEIHAFSLPQILQQFEQADLLLIAGANPCVTFPRSDQWRAMLERKNAIVVDTNLTQTSQRASVFLRVGGMFAQPDICGSYFFDGVARRTEIVEDLYPSDSSTAAALAERLELRALSQRIRSLPEQLQAHQRPLPIRQNDPLDPIPVQDPMPVPPGHYRLLSGSHHLWLNSQALEKYGHIDNELWLSQQVATRERLRTGDRVRLVSSAGLHNRVEMIARVHPCVEGDWLWYFKGRPFLQGFGNDLAEPHATDAGSFAYYDCFVRVEPVD